MIARFKSRNVSKNQQLSRHRQHDSFLFIFFLHIERRVVVFIKMLRLFETVKSSSRLIEKYFPSHAEFILLEFILLLICADKC